MLQPLGWLERKDEIAVATAASDAKPKLLTYRKPETFTLKLNTGFTSEILKNNPEIISFTKSYISDDLYIVETDGDYLDGPWSMLELENVQSDMSKFWHLSEMSPYELFTSECDDECLSTDIISSNRVSEYDYSRYIFWDIETYSPDGSFTDPQILDHAIIMISMVMVYLGKVETLILMIGEVNESKIPKLEFELRIRKFKNEAELISAFYDEWISFSPDRVIGYNTDSYDIPYVIIRSKLNNIEVPNLGKLSSFNTTKYKRFPSFKGFQMEIGWDTPLVECLDLIHYYRIFHPGMENYKLETIGRYFAGVGKSGLAISDMFDYIASGDPTLMAEVLYYSIMDSILLYKLCLTVSVEGHVNVMAHMIDTCNEVRCTLEEIITFKPEDVISRALYHIDFATSVSSLVIGKIAYMLKAKNGIYKNVYEESYRTHIVSVLGERDDLFLSSVGVLCEVLPMNMVNKMIHSQYIHDDIKSKCSNSILRTEDLFEVDENFMYTFSTTPNIDLYVVIGGDKLKKVGEKILRHGNGKFSKPTCILFKEYIDKYVANLYINIDYQMEYIGPEDIEGLDIDMYKIKYKVKPLEQYSDYGTSIYKKLAQKVKLANIVHTGKMEVSMIWDKAESERLVLDGEKLTPNLVKYSSELNKIIRILNELPRSV